MSWPPPSTVCLIVFGLFLFAALIDCNEQPPPTQDGSGQLLENNPNDTFEQQPTSTTMASVAHNQTAAAAAMSKQALLKPAYYQLARRYGMNSVFTGLLYSLSIVPLLFALKSMFANRNYGYYGLYRRKRATITGRQQQHLPFMNIEETKRFISLFESTLAHMKIGRNKTCRDYYLCQVFKDAMKQRSLPALSEFEVALLNLFGAVAERYNYRFDPASAVRRYYETATGAFSGVRCSHKYPCDPANLFNRTNKQP